MKFFAAFVALATSVSAYQLKFNSIFDDPNQSLEPLACGGGQNGLITRGYHTIGDLPSRIAKGGVSNVNYNSPDCGSCWQLKYKGNGIYVIAVDSAVDGLFNVANSGVDYLTHGEGIAWGTVDLDDAYKVDPACCEMPSDGQCS